MQVENLSLENYAHLFRWSGALLYGEDQAPQVAPPADGVKERSPEDWQYQSFRSAPFPDRKLSPQPTPLITATERRQQLGLGNTVIPSYDRYGSNPQGFDNPIALDDPISAPQRANLAVAFDLQQSRLVENPLVDRWNLRTFTADFVGAPKPDKAAYWKGVHLTIDAFSHATLQFSLLSLEMVKLLKRRGSVQTIYAHAQVRHTSTEIARILDRLSRQDFSNHWKSTDAQLSFIRQQQKAWAERGRLAVLAPDGSLDELLTLVNMATAIVGIHQLEQAASECYGSLRGMDAAIEELARVVS